MFASASTTLMLHSLSNNKLHSLAAYKPKNVISAGQKITQISWCHDNSYMLMLQEGNLPQILLTRDLPNMSLVHTIQAFKSVTAVQFKNNTKRCIAVGNKNGEIVLYDSKNRNIISKLVNVGAPINSLEFNSTDDKLAVTTTKNLIIFSDLNNTNNFLDSMEFEEAFTTMKFHPSVSNILATGNKEGTISLREMETHDVIYELQRHSAPLTSLTFADGHKHVISTGMDKKICISDYISGDCAFRMNVQRVVSSLDISPDEVYLAAGLEDGLILIYDLRQPLTPLIHSHAHEGPVNKIVFQRIPLSMEATARHSTMSLNENFDTQHEIRCMGDSDKYERPLEEIKKDLMKMIQTHMTELDNKLTENCMKFQMFLNKEFDSINTAMARWDVFNIGDTSETVNMDSDMHA